MTQPNAELSNSPPLSPVARFLWAALILATLYLCYFHNLGAIGLVGPDEPRYAWIARDMAESGDWVTPRLYGKPWFEKPVLYYWGAALSFKLFGVSEVAARLPSAVSALLATLALAWLALPLYGAETARWLLLLLPTTVGMIGFSHAAATDMPFAATLTIAMVFAAGIVGLVEPKGFAIYTPSISFYSNTRPGGLVSLLLFGFCLGLATLAKGPAAIILSGGAVLLWAAFTKRWRDAFHCLHPLAIASFCLTALPWYILCARRNPDFFRVFIIEHNFKRFLTPEFQHIQPFWFYIPILLIAVFPWTMILFAQELAALGRTLKARELWTSHQAMFFCAWPLFCFLFFSVSRSKLPGYLLPAIPPLVLLLAKTMANGPAQKLRSLKWELLVTGMLLIIFGLVLRHQAPKIPALLCVGPACGITPIWTLAVAGGIVVAALAAIRKLRACLLAAILVVLLLVIEIDRFLPNLDPGVSARDAVRVASNVWPEFNPRNAASLQLSRSYLYQLSFYARVEIPEYKVGGVNSTWLFVPKGKQAEAANLGFHCVNFAVDPAVIPCQLAPSVGAFGGSLGSGSAGSHGDHR